MAILYFFPSMRQLLVTANAILSSPILVTLMVEAQNSYETSILTRATWRNIPEEAILQYGILLVTGLWRHMSAVTHGWKCASPLQCVSDHQGSGLRESHS
jgi:hypothetical protein